jgi:ferrochelatase
VKGLVLVPLGFVSDHIETLYDMDIVYRNLARARGMEYRRLRAFNADPDFIALLGGLVRERLGR